MKSMGLEPKRPDGLLRAFAMSGMQIADDLSAIERKYGVELGHLPVVRNRMASGYDQFEAHLRRDAARMSEFYEVFYCLENSIRELVTNAMIDAEGADWWIGKRVDEARIRKPAAERRAKEIDSGVTERSDNLIDYTTFGELAQLITDNWDIFDPIFKSKRAVSNLTNQLNLLRGPIAHCNPTEEIEQERLLLAVRSWFGIIS